ncbi:hypothetical protein [Clostridium sp.]|uniref:hypothetical protein n=1 Tax=Clostridium TaxID=1485 RepID=UPI0025B99EF3|nr:hypothetical protein [Clostridium sp.]MBS4958948.1 hypothetical protein [Clostridium sp.]MDU2158178.1 hypothetical protein [Clostridium sp.]
MQSNLLKIASSSKNIISIQDFKVRNKSKGISRDDFSEEGIYSEGIKKEVFPNMDDNKILEKYLDRVDQDRRDQEERLSKNMQLMEHRISEERKASEERLEKMFLTTMESIKDTNKKIDDLNGKINENEKTLIKEISSANKDIRNISISTILGIAAMVITIIIAFITMKPSV